MLARNVEKPELWSIADGKVNGGAAMGHRLASPPQSHTEYPWGPAITLRDINKTETGTQRGTAHASSQQSYIHNSQEMETT